MRPLAEARAELEQAIEDAIAALDRYDGDPDLEPEEDAEHDGREPEDYDGLIVAYAGHGTTDEDQTRFADMAWGVRP